MPDPLSAQAPYRWLLLTGIVLGALGWWRMARRDRRLVLVYLTGLLGAFVGAKVAFLLAEGWTWRAWPTPWLALVTGKSVLGALPGGYAGVEFAKARLGYPERTGDWFAAYVPVGIALGRVGCWFQGCCPGLRCERPAWWTLTDGAGVPRWPAVPVELGFNVVALTVFWVLRRQRLFVGQHFHLYLVAYGLFRFVHEFARDTPRFLRVDGSMLGITAYQGIALAVAGFGAWAYARRAMEDRRGAADKGDSPTNLSSAPPRAARPG